MNQKEAEFLDRSQCINCGSSNLKKLSGGFFGDDPLCSLIENDPWGESPMSFIEKKKWSFVQCKDCAQMFHKYILSPEWNEVRFESWMTADAMEKFSEPKNTIETNFNKTKQHVTHILRLEKMTQKIRGNKPVRILDFGCGWGDFLATADRFGFIGYGVDRSSARRKLGQHGVIFQDIEELKNERNSFHVITLFEVLEHLDTPLTVLKSLSKLIVPGGILVLETPDCAGVTNIKDMTTYRKIHPLDHINAFTSETLSSIAGHAGFRKIKPCLSIITTNRAKIIKSEIKHLLYNFKNLRSTRQYFIKC